MTGAPVQQVDQHEIKFAMGMTLTLLALGWVIDSWMPVAVAAVCQLLSASGSPYAPYSLLYRRVLLPAQLLKPHAIQDDPVPHRFASLIGGILTLAGTLFQLLGYSTVGWLFIITVFTLQNLNFWVNFCIMYYMYYLLGRLGVPGFSEPR
jgi:hypothetical protein